MFIFRSLSHSGVPMTLILLFFLLSLTIAFAITFYVYLQKNEEAHTQIRKLRHEYRSEKYCIFIKLIFFKNTKYKKTKPNYNDNT